MAANTWQILGAYQTNSMFYAIESARRSRSPQPAARPAPPASFPLQKYAYNQFMQTAAMSVASIFQSARNVGQAAEKLTGNESALHSRRADSSNAEAATGKAAANAKLASYRIQVDSTAASQKNAGFSFDKSAASVLSPGKHTFELKAGQKTASLSVNIYAWDTNEQALTKVRNAINGSNSGVSAALARDEKAGTLRLELTSNETGTDHAFSLTDTEGNAVNGTGIGTASRNAQNASYRLNGGALQHSQSNTLTLDDGKVEVTLKEASANEVTIATKADDPAIVKQVQELLSCYNQLQAAAGGLNGLVSQTAAKGFQHAFSIFNMEQLGISKRADGSLELDENELRQHIEHDLDGVTRSLTGFGGLATGLAKAADRLQEMPPEALLNKRGSLFKSYTNYSFAGTLQSYLPVPMTGLLLNSYF